MSKKRLRRVLLICGSPNQTTQMTQIAAQMPEFSHSFTPFYGDRASQLARRLGWLESTIMGNKLRQGCVDYLRDHGLEVDLDGHQGPYDLVITCSDLAVPRNVRRTPLVLVQEGMTDPETWLSRLVRRAQLPLICAGTTALTGLSGLYQRFCVASDGYRDFFARSGAPPERLVVTGIPNFDNCASYLDNDVPYRGYLLLCTTDMRETLRYEDRPALLRRVHELAAGRPIHIKLHPNENHKRAKKEISKHCPSAIVHTRTRAEYLVANCDELVTQYSSLAYVGLALDKPVHSCFDISTLRRLLPNQNGGSSAKNIANVCRDLLGPAKHGQYNFQLDSIAQRQRNVGAQRCA